MWTRLERFAPLAGVAVLIIFVYEFFTPTSPDTGDSAAEMVKWWTDHKTAMIWASLIGALGAVLLIWFGASVLRLVWRAEGSDGRLATLVFAGHFLAALGILTFCGFSYVTANSVGKVSPDGTQTLAVINNDLFLIAVAGVLLLFASSGLAILRYRVLPQWLGWVCLLFALVALTPFGWFAFLAVGLWAGFVGILLFLRSEPSRAEAPLAAGVGAQGA